MNGRIVHGALPLFRTALLLITDSVCSEIEVVAFDFYQGGRTEAFSQRTDAKACWALDKAPELLTHLFEDSRSESPALRQIEAYAQRYHFFHFEVAFPEAFAGEKKGFDIILGNPQWDKTRLFDTDFFPQYHSNYRSLKNSEKAAVQKRLLEGEHIATAYQTAQRSMEVANEYYKVKATFPLNSLVQRGMSLNGARISNQK